ncbi:MAG: hypothetical protein JNJ98_19220, partial [Gemmatimonadetes bacterium]|nr:hypothetical protein [Gemmatimonadota bacterium]
VAEVFEQVNETRRQLGDASGNVHFPMNAFVHSTDRLNDRLAAGPYAEPALVPAAPWLSRGVSPVPAAAVREHPEGIELRVQRAVPPTSRPAAAPAVSRDATRARTAVPPAPATNDPRWWVVRAAYPDGWRVQVVDADREVVRLAVDPAGSYPTAITVSAVDRSGQESAPVIVRR